MQCRGCASDQVVVVLDLGSVAAADYFPDGDALIDESETGHHLAMGMCQVCLLAQLISDDTTTEEPLGVEPQALKDQANEAICALFDEGVMSPGDTVREFTSPHGGRWLPEIVSKGGVSAASGEPATVVVDSFGMMHEPDQRQAARDRAEATAPDGILLLQFHSLRTIVGEEQWMSLRHGHFAYYSLTALRTLLASVGMSVTAVWEFDLYGGTVLIAARHSASDLQYAPCVADLCALEASEGVTAIDRVATLGTAVDTMLAEIRETIGDAVAAGKRVYAYGAASRAVAAFALARLTSKDIRAVADASPGKQGRRMPGTDIPIISPEALVDAGPDIVWLTLPDLRSEVAAACPVLGGRWITIGN